MKLLLKITQRYLKLLSQYNRKTAVALQIHNRTIIMIIIYRTSLYDCNIIQQ